MAKVLMSRVYVPGYDLPLYAPIDKDSESALSGAEEIIFDYKKKRSAGNHRRYFAFIKKAFAMHDGYDNQEIFRKVLQLEAGHFDTAITEGGKSVYLARSIKWDELGEVEFKKLFNEVVNAFIKVYAHKLTNEQIDQIAGF